MSNIQQANIPSEGFENEPIWLPRLFVNNQVIEGVSFRNCRIMGPGIVVPLGDTSIINCSFPDPVDSFIWVITEERDSVYGAMGFVDCQFIGCVFEASVGLAGPQSLKDTILADSGS